MILLIVVDGSDGPMTFIFPVDKVPTRKEVEEYLVDDMQQLITEYFVFSGELVESEYIR